MNRISILLVIVMAIVLAACGGEETTASPTADEPTATAIPTPSPSEPSETAAPTTGTGAESPVAIPSFDLDGDPELAARFPDTVDGQPLQVQSIDGDTFATMGGSDPTFTEFLDAVGAELQDVSVAFGGAMFGETVLSVGAFRVLGASEEELEREFIGASEAAGEMSGLSEATVGGKQVRTAQDPSGETDVQVFIYTQDDTLYFMTGSEAHVAEILEALP